MDKEVEVPEGWEFAKKDMPTYRNSGGSPTGTITKGDLFKRIDETYLPIDGYEGRVLAVCVQLDPAGIVYVLKQDL